MKKLLSILVVMAVCVSLTACGGGPSNVDSSTKETSKENDSVQADAPREEPIEEEPEQTKAEEQKGESYEITYQNVRTWIDSIGVTWAQVIVEITNAGSENLYLSSGSFDLEDADGNLVTSKSLVSTYPNVLAPGEKGYMYEETVLENYSGDGDLTLSARPDVEKAKVDLIRYETTDVTVSDKEFGGVGVMGRVENTTDEAADGMVYIVAFFYDESGVPIGSAFTILSEDLEPGSKIGFEFTGFSLPDDITADAVASTTVYAYPLQYQF